MEFAAESTRAEINRHKENIKRAEGMIREAQATIKHWRRFIKDEQAKADALENKGGPVVAGFADEREPLEALVARLKRRAQEQRGAGQ